MAYVIRGCAVTDARSGVLAHDQSVVVTDRTIAWMGPDDQTPVPAGARIIDGSGSTLVPAMVDSHSHLTLPGGAHWIEHIADDPATLLEVAHDNGTRLVRAGIRWARDVGSPRGIDPADGIERALAVGLRDRWAGRADLPYVRAAGTWISRSGTLTGMIEVDDGDGLVAAVERQLDEGADLIKLYLDGPDRETAPFTPSEVARAVRTAQARSARVAAHATLLDGTRSAVLGGVDSIEHGVEIDADLAAEMAARRTHLVTTHSVWKSWSTFAETTTLERFTEGAARIAARTEAAYESTRIAHRAGVAIAGGSDFGGGSVRAGDLAWEVECLVECGLEPWEALAAVTWRGGDLLNEGGAGRIWIGGASDFFLVHGNPLSDPRALWRVWFTG
jgi:imidazolonepropionase-like amidohydrolase